MSSLTPDIRDLTAPGVAIANAVLTSLNEDLDFRLDQHWCENIFRKFPKPFAYRIVREYEENYLFDGYQSANRTLEQHWKRCSHGHIPLNANTYDLEQLAKTNAKEMRMTASTIHDDVAAAVQLWPLVEMRGIEPPSLNTPNISPTGILRRFCDDAWWNRKLRKTHARNYEAEAISLGFVHQHAGVYISDAMFNQHQENKGRNRRILDRLIAINETEQLFMLQNLVEKSELAPVFRIPSVAPMLPVFAGQANRHNTLPD